MTYLVIRNLTMSNFDVGVFPSGWWVHHFHCVQLFQSAAHPIQNIKLSLPLYKRLQAIDIIKLFGLSRFRTEDLRIKSPLLCQLS